MSRCFPFPPPGYEKKLTTDDPDLLKKEKRREKKHKKDKEKKDGKEKREKSRSEGKHKEKKDKHRDKEKSENSTPDEKNIYGQFKGYNGETLHHNNEQNNDGKFVVEGRKIYVNRVEMQKTDGRQVVMDVAVPNRINGATPPPLNNIKIEKLQEKGIDDKQGDKRKYEDRDKRKDKEMEKEKKMEKLKEKK